MLSNIDYEADNLYQMVYVSQITTTGMLKKDTLKNIEKISSNYNAVENISSVCCYGKGYFFQYAEGSEQALTNLKNILLRNNRHQNMRIIDFSELSKRKFAKWPIRLLILEDWRVKNKQLKQLIPFEPCEWEQYESDQCIEILHEYYNEKIKKDEMEVLQPTYSTLGILVSAIVGQHQAYIIVKAMIILMVAVCILVFIYARFTGII